MRYKIRRLISPTRSQQKMLEDGVDVQQITTMPQNYALVMVAMTAVLALGCSPDSARLNVAELDHRTSAEISTWPIVSVSASSGSASLSNIKDKNALTVWQSDSHTTAQNVEWVQFFFDTFHSINAVKLTTDFSGSTLGFPVEFTVRWFNGSSWQYARSYTHYPKPTSQIVQLDLLQTFNASGVEINARVLGEDGTGGYQLAFADVGAGLDVTKQSQIYQPNQVQTSTAITGWQKERAIDGNIGTVWSSQVDTSSTHAEWIAYWWPQGLKPINAIRIRPRYSSSNVALGFPVNFTIDYSDGSQWVQDRVYTNFPTPYRGDWIILPLAGTFMANGIRITANTLGYDDVGNFVFQLAEVQAEFEYGFNLFQRYTNDGTAHQNAFIGAVGSEQVNRSDQFNHWNKDERGPIISAANTQTVTFPDGGTNENVYAPNAVFTGTGWNVYFGGWDGGSLPQNDYIYLTQTSNFFSFTPHQEILRPANVGIFPHVNNPSVLRVGSTLHMLFTVWDKDYPSTVGGVMQEGINQTGYVSSSSGTSWSSSLASRNNLISVPSMPRAYSTYDMNGANVLYYENGLYHAYLFDYRETYGPDIAVVHLATEDPSLQTWSYLGKLSSITKPINDLKAFAYGGSNYFVSVYNPNGPFMPMAVGSDPYNLGSLRQAFSFCSSNSDTSCYVQASPTENPNPCVSDEPRHVTPAPGDCIVSSGLLVDGSRLYGILYGGTAGSDFRTPERIYARWLQKKIIFENASVRWGDTATGFGYNEVRMHMNIGQNVETGYFSVYDTDGITLLFKSPAVTMRAGDRWYYSPL